MSSFNSIRTIREPIRTRLDRVVIGLLGFGTVGSGVYHILAEQRALIAQRLHRQTGRELEIVIKKILVRDISKHDPAVQPLMTTNPSDILLDDDIDIVCELIGGDDLATDCINLALQRGKHVITANKKAIFGDRGGFERTARNHQVCFRFEGAVGGVIPIIRVLGESLSSDEIFEIQGILNGSTNYILTQVSQGCPFEAAMVMAAEQGYLEADPSSDLDGYDAMYKLAILSQLITGQYPEETSIERKGLSSIREADLASARERNEKIKLISRLRNEEGIPHLSVKPEVIDADHPLYNIDGAMNGVLVKGRNCGDLFFSGAGAGSRETATAVIGDLLTIIRSEYATIGAGTRSPAAEQADHPDNPGIASARTPGGLQSVYCQTN